MRGGIARQGTGDTRPSKVEEFIMGQEVPHGFERLRNGEQLQFPTFANVAAAVAAGVTAAKFPRRIIHLSAGGTGGVPCLAISDGTNWKQIAIGANAV